MSRLIVVVALLLPPSIARAWDVFGGLGYGTAGGVGRLDFGWKLADAWHVEAQLTSSVGIPAEDVRLAAAGGVRWSPVRWGPVEPRLFAGVTHAHEMSASHLASRPLHAILGSDGHTKHRSGIGAGAGLVATPIAGLPLQLGLKASAFTYLPDGRAPFSWELVAGLGWAFE